MNISKFCNLFKNSQNPTKFCNLFKNYQNPYSGEYIAEVISSDALNEKAEPDPSTKQETDVHNQAINQDLKAAQDAAKAASGAAKGVLGGMVGLGGSLLGSITLSFIAVKIDKMKNIQNFMLNNILYYHFSKRTCGKKLLKLLI